MLQQYPTIGARVLPGNYSVRTDVACRFDASVKAARIVDRSDMRMALFI